MIDFTEDERNLIRQIKIELVNMLPKDFDFEAKENLLTAVNIWKAKGFCIARRADGGKQSDLYISIRRKLGAPIPTKEEVVKIQKQKEIDEMLKKTNAMFDRKVSRILKSYKATKAEKEAAINRHRKNINSELENLERKKAELEEQLRMAETAEERLEKAREDERKRLEKEMENPDEKEDENGDKMRKCWNCGEWFKVAGGVFTKHSKECKSEEEMLAELEKGDQE